MNGFDLEEHLMHKNNFPDDFDKPRTFLTESELK